LNGTVASDGSPAELSLAGGVPPSLLDGIGGRIVR